MCRIKFLAKNPSGSISLSTSGVELVDSKDLPFCKYYNAPKWENKFDFELKTERLQSKVVQN